MRVAGCFLYYFCVCMVKTMSFESTGGRQEPRAGKDLVTRIPVNAAKTFQTDTVCRWNKEVDDPTLSMYLGLLAINDGVSRESGAITLDLLIRSGVLFQDEDESWSLVEDYRSRLVCVHGDANTIENMARFVQDIQEHKISSTDANLQNEIFMEALTCVHDLPSD